MRKDGTTQVVKETPKTEKKKPRKVRSKQKQDELRILTLVEYHNTSVIDYGVISDLEQVMEDVYDGIDKDGQMFLSNSDIHMVYFDSPMDIDTFTAQYMDEIQSNCIADVVTITMYTLTVPEEKYQKLLTEGFEGDIADTLATLFRTYRTHKGPVKVQGVYSIMQYREIPPNDLKA